MTIEEAKKILITSYCAGCVAWCEDEERCDGCEIKEATKTVIKALEKKERNKWIPIENEVPNNDQYVLVSFVNYPVVSIARYEEDDDGGGSFYPGDEDESFLSFGVIVDAWQELPKNYSESVTDEKLTNADRIRSMTDEELAVFLAKTRSDIDILSACVIPYRAENVSKNLEWLQKDVKE